MSDQVFDILITFFVLILIVLAFGAGRWYEALTVKDAIDCSMCICKAVIP